MLISFERTSMVMVFVCFLPWGLGKARKVIIPGNSSIQIMISRSEVTGKTRTGQRLKASLVGKTEKDNSYHWLIPDCYRLQCFAEPFLNLTSHMLTLLKVLCNHLWAAHAETAVLVQTTGTFRPVPSLQKWPAADDQRMLKKRARRYKSKSPRYLRIEDFWS